MTFGKLLKIIALPAAIGVIVWLENRRPLRKEVGSKSVRRSRNLLMAGTASAAMILVEKPVVDRVLKFVEEKKFGLLKIFKIPRTLEIILTIFLLDYTIYLWHVSAHKVPFLWKFHLVHHLDPDLDSSTAYRFHFGEILISVLWRAMQILLLGASPEAVKIWQVIMLPAVLFHHSNIQLPADFDERLSRIFVTPKLHGIHHSALQKETDSNWSTIFSLWDRIHGTLKTDVNQSEIVIGVESFQSVQDADFAQLIRLPFEKSKRNLQLSSGSVSDR